MKHDTTLPQPRGPQDDDPAADPATRPRLIVYAISGERVDAAELGAQMARWIGDAGTVACWAGDPLARGTANEGVVPQVAPVRLAVAVASRRAEVFAAAHLQLHGAADIAALVALADEVQLRDRLRGEAPHAVLVDEQLLPVLDAATAARLRGLHALVLCDRVHSGTAQCVLARGLRGCLAIEAPTGNWAKALAAVRRGELWLPRAALQQAATGSHAFAPPLPLDALTPREAETVALLREGLSNKQIARRLGVCEDTVKKHLQHSFAKLGVHRRALVVLGRR